MTNETSPSKDEQDTTEPTTAVAADASVDELAAANERLRKRVADLESMVSEIHESISPDEPSEDSASTPEEPDDEATMVLPSGGQTYKVRGKLEESNGGVGVFGFNTASNGTTYGVWGEVDSGSGYGLYTPNAGRTDGDLEVRSGNLLLNPQNDSSNIVNIDMEGDFGSYWWHNPDYGTQGPITGFSKMNEVRMHAQLWAYQDLYFDPDGTVQRTAGPVAKGVIRSDGTIANAVNVTGVTRAGSSNNGYAIDIDGVDYDRDKYVTIVTSNHPYLTDTGAIGTSPSSLVVYLMDSSGTKHSADFQFVTYEVSSGSVTTSSSSTSTEDHVADSS